MIQFILPIILSVSPIDQKNYAVEHCVELRVNAVPHCFIEQVEEGRPSRWYMSPRSYVSLHDTFLRPTLQSWGDNLLVLSEINTTYRGLRNKALGAYLYDMSALDRSNPFVPTQAVGFPMGTQAIVRRPDAPSKTAQQSAGWSAEQQKGNALAVCVFGTFGASLTRAVEFAGIAAGAAIAGGAGTSVAVGVAIAAAGVGAVAGAASGYAENCKDQSSCDEQPAPAPTPEPSPNPSGSTPAPNPTTGQTPPVDPPRPTDGCDPAVASCAQSSRTNPENPYYTGSGNVIVLPEIGQQTILSQSQAEAARRAAGQKAPTMQQRLAPVINPVPIKATTIRALANPGSLRLY